jgi:hypothetical protein
MSITHVGPSQNNQLSGISHNVDVPISELSNYLKRWLVLQDEIVALNSELKGRRTQAKALKEIILRIMNSNKVAALNTSKGTILHKTRESSEKLSNDYLLKHCKNFFEGDEERAKALIKYLEDNRTVIKKHDLKLQISRADDDKNSRNS